MVKVKFQESGENAGKRIEGIGLALFFIWVGFCWFLEFHPSVPLIGVGVIVFSVQLTRILFGLKHQGFWLFVGSVFLFIGLIQRLRENVKIIPVLFVAVGILILIRNVRLLMKT
ncbi:MAG: hypothetical protein JW928_05320 [Candidatus Aureabacteria bacterium]|nr:hypothetical protein [Candidatus Auribacterota bacterium]